MLSGSTLRSTLNYYFSKYYEVIGYFLSFFDPFHLSALYRSGRL